MSLDLFEGREGCSCSDEALEVIPPPGNKKRVWIAVPEQTVIPGGTRVSNAANKRQMDSNKTVPLTGAHPAGTL